MNDEKNILSQVPDISRPLRSVLESEDELLGLKGVVKILRGKGKGEDGYFIESFIAKFADELDEDVECEKVYVNHADLEILIKLPNPSDEKLREAIRRDATSFYALGVDDLKTRTAITSYMSLKDNAKKSLVEKEKERVKND